jgi:hypothetical protein
MLQQQAVAQNTKIDELVQDRTQALNLKKKNCEITSNSSPPPPKAKDKKHHKPNAVVCRIRNMTGTLLLT